MRKVSFSQKEWSGDLASRLDWVASSSCEITTWLAWDFFPAESHTLKLFSTLSHTLPLHDSHLNLGFLNEKLHAKWHGIKPTKWLIKFNLTYPLYPRNVESFQREFWERNPREKQDWLIHNLHLLILQNSSTLTLSIVTSLRGTLAKTFSHHTYISEKIFWCLGSSSEGTNSFAWCNGLLRDPVS